MDKREFRKRVLLDLAGNPRTLFPLVGGATLLLLAFAGLGPIVGFVGFMGIIVGVANFVWLLTKGEVPRKVMEELRQEAEKQRDLALDLLRKRLVQDGDPRTQKLLDDLRQLHLGFVDTQRWSEELGSVDSFNIYRTVEELFNVCVTWLERSLQLAERAANLKTETVRATVLEQRESIIKDITDSVIRLGRVLGEIQHLSSEAETPRIAELRQELEDNLLVAQRVDRQMAAIRSGDFTKVPE